ncbi:MAG: hypothetical protein LBL13_14045 [Bacteroidales bacterium]|nr:hypothetical protein [Bacteroidales bacterium]
MVRQPNYWYYRPDAEHTVLVFSGEDYYQEEGKPLQVIKGRCDSNPANVRHWNGATSANAIVCMTVTELTSDGHVIQFKLVTDEEYNSLLK